MQVLSVGLQVEDGVPDELPRAVIGDVAASTDLVQLDPQPSALLSVGQDVLVRRGGPEGDDVGVLEQKELVGDDPLPPRSDQTLLK